MKCLRIAALLVLTGLLAACPKPATIPEDSGSDIAVPGTRDGTGIDTPRVQTPVPLSEEERRRLEAEALLQDRIIYFDYDRAEIRSEFRDTIAAHARRLAGDSSLRVRLEGHTDERGSREYNIGLGERRAHSVRRVLLLQGVSAGQVTTVSFGQERPASPGHDEASWSLNRRVEIVYTR